MMTLYDHLIFYGYNAEDASEISDAYYDYGLEAAVDVFSWADDETHDYTSELRDEIMKWQKENETGWQETALSDDLW